MRAGQEFFDGDCGCDHGSDEPAQPATRRTFLRGAATAASALAAPMLFTAACSSPATAKRSATPTTAGSSGAASPATHSGTPSTASSSSPSSASSIPPATTAPSTSAGKTAAGSAVGRPPGPETADPALLAARYDGLRPFAPAPPPPAVKPVDTNVPLPPVVDHIPTDKPICFLTIDDGAEKDPVFLDMVKDFRVPITLFLTDAMIRNDYGYFAKLKDTGYCTIQNHTLTHPNLVEVSPDRQRAEIAGQQQKLTAEYGTTPYLFRAPYGNSNQVTQQACKENGLTAILRWRASFQKQGFQWQAADKHLRPGDILLAHFRGPKALGPGWPEMHILMINLFRIVQDQGFTFARLEDYI